MNNNVGSDFSNLNVQQLAKASQGTAPQAQAAPAINFAGTGTGDSVSLGLGAGSPVAQATATTKLPPESIKFMQSLSSRDDDDLQGLVGDGLVNQSTLEGLTRLALLA